MFSFVIILYSLLVAIFVIVTGSDLFFQGVLSHVNSGLIALLCCC